MSHIERSAVADFTLLIEGAIGQQPHSSLIEVSVQTPFGDSYR